MSWGEDLPDNEVEVLAEAGVDDLEVDDGVLEDVVGTAVVEDEVEGVAVPEDACFLAIVLEA